MVNERWSERRQKLAFALIWLIILGVGFYDFNRSFADLSSSIADAGKGKFCAERLVYDSDGTDKVLNLFIVGLIEGDLADMTSFAGQLRT